MADDQKATWLTQALLVLRFTTDDALREQVESRLLENVRANLKEYRQLHQADELELPLIEGVLAFAKDRELRLVVDAHLRDVVGANMTTHAHWPCGTQAPFVL